MIYFDNVSKHYSDGRASGLEEITFQVEPKEFVSIVGHSGAGKTTLLKMIIAEDRPSAGTVFYESVDVHRIPKSKLPQYRRSVPRLQITATQDRLRKRRVCDGGKRSYGR